MPTMFPDNAADLARPKWILVFAPIDASAKRHLRHDELEQLKCKTGR